MKQFSYALKALEGHKVKRSACGSQVRLLPSLGFVVLALCHLFSVPTYAFRVDNGAFRSMNGKSELVRDSVGRNEVESVSGSGSSGGSNFVPLSTAIPSIPTCRDDNENMLRKYPIWRTESSDFEEETLRLCMNQWADEIVPAGVVVFPQVQCATSPSWRSACQDAGGMVATVIATADFPKSGYPGYPRTLLVPTCFSTSKVCTSSRYASDYLWSDRLQLISSWCVNQTIPALQCTNVKISTNFWTVFNLPKIIRLVVGLIAAVVAVAIGIAVFCYCRYKRKLEHNKALERALLLRAARRSTHSRVNSTYASDVESAAPSSSSSATPTLPRSTTAITSTTPLLLQSPSP